MSTQTSSSCFRKYLINRVSDLASSITHEEEKCNVYWDVCRDHQHLDRSLSNKKIKLFTVEGAEEYYILQANCHFASITNVILELYMLYRDTPLKALHITDYDINDNHLTLYAVIDKQYHV